MNRIRRDVLCAAVALGASRYCRAAGANLKEELQCGDPRLAFEQLAFDPDAVERKRQKEDKAAFEPRIQDFGRRLISEAGTWVGKGRTSSRDEIAKLLALFDLPFESAGRPVPFCAAGVSYVASMVYARAKALRIHDPDTTADLGVYLGDVDHFHFVPSPSVWDMFYVAKGKRRWQDAKPGVPPHPGWLVIFNFGKGADHVGIVETADKTSISTIEFNTVPQTGEGSNSNGGWIARRKRPYTVPMIKGFVETDVR